MAIVHNVEIVWDDLLDAFTNGKGELVYFLDRLTGEIFHVPSVIEDEEFWRHFDTNRDRFLEIPRFDYPAERQFMTSFIGRIEDSGLKQLLGENLAGRRPYGNMYEIIDFFPEEQDRLMELRDEYMSSRVQTWLEEHNLFSADSALFSARL